MSDLDSDIHSALDLTLMKAAGVPAPTQNVDEPSDLKNPAQVIAKSLYPCAFSNRMYMISFQSFCQSTKESREKQMTSQRKLHVRHTFEDVDELGRVLCKFVCTTFWAGQFEAVRAEYLKDDENIGFIRSLSMSRKWSAQGGKSGANFSKSVDDRFIIKVVSKVELQMFLDFAPAYFEYMAKACFHGLPTVLCKLLGVYTVGYHNKETGKKVMENVVIMENIFYQVCGVLRA
jgi:hypothetical protein